MIDKVVAQNCIYTSCNVAQIQLLNSQRYNDIVMVLIKSVVDSTSRRVNEKWDDTPYCMVIRFSVT